jgi:hypothetical protein
MRETAVDFVCTRAEHRTRASTFGTLTVHDGKWAYCPAEGITEEHQWSPVYGAVMARLRIAARQRIVPRRV